MTDCAEPLIIWSIVMLFIIAGVAASEYWKQ